ncbi:MAG: family nitrogen regulator [Solirubrobacterales bacterium]|jgi:nitrogen regulatory protein PII|nr:family nitrogen regulator [Solirubrobacterales bacterium]
MKMVVAYVEPECFDPIRDDLLGLGFVSLSVVNANGSLPEATTSGSYRGVKIEQHLRPKARIECVVGADHAPTVVDTVLKHGGERCFVFVVPVEQAYPTDTVKTDAVAVEAG